MLTSMCIVIFLKTWKSAFTVITTDSNFRADDLSLITGTIRKVCVMVNGGSSIRGGWNWEQRATSWSSRRLRCHVWVFVARLITCIDQQREVRENRQTYPPTHITTQTAYPFYTLILALVIVTLAIYALKPLSLSNLS